MPESTIQVAVPNYPAEFGNEAYRIAESMEASVAGDSTLAPPYQAAAPAGDYYSAAELQQPLQQQQHAARCNFGPCMQAGLSRHAMPQLHIFVCSSQVQLMCESAGCNITTASSTTAACNTDQCLFREAMICLHIHVSSRLCLRQSMMHAF